MRFAAIIAAAARAAAAAAVVFTIVAPGPAAAQQPRPAQPQATQPQVTSPQPAQPQPTQPQATSPQPTQPQATQPQPAQPQASHETAAPAPAPSPRDPAAGIDTVKEALQDIESVYRASHESEAALAVLMTRLAPLRDDLRDRLERLEPRLREIEKRATEIANPPAQGAPEDPLVTAERQRLTARKNEIAAALQQLKFLAGQGNTLDLRIRHSRREVFNSQLFTRTTVADPAFWADLGRSVPQAFGGLSEMLSSWGASVRAQASIGHAIAAAVLLALLVTLVSILARWTRRLSSRPTPRRVDKAAAAMARVFEETVIVPGLIEGVVQVLRSFSLVSEAAAEAGAALAFATLIAGFGRGVAAGLFAPGEGDRRIIALPDHEAQSYASHLTWAARAVGLVTFANEMVRILDGDGAATPLVANNALGALALLAIIAHLVWQSARFAAADAADDSPAPRGWLRTLLWAVGAAIAVGLSAGYVGFAAFVGTRMLALVTASGAVVILVTLIDALLTDLLGSSTPYGRRTATAFGLTARGLDLITMLVSAVLRLVVIALAAVFALNALGVFKDDIVSTLHRAISDYDIGSVRVSPVGILTALACLILGAAAVRGAQRWLSVKFLPRTGLEAGLQNSIVSLSGYSALVVVLAISLGILGIDLQKIAFIAGALSVGIGFGLQSVVANFISGLILLAERSIRVGDWVVVKNDEGFVRRISIRSTEIETFDRASVIIPNQEFITGAVKNWTHSNTVGRVIVKVRVAFDSDLTQVRELLFEAAARHQQVLPGTPAVLITGLGDIGVDLQVICMISNLSQGGTVQTELYMDILTKFRDAGIRIPYPVHDTGVPAPPIAAVQQPAAKIA